MQYCAAWVPKNMFNALRTSISPPDKSSNVIHPNLFLAAKWETLAALRSLTACTVIAHIFHSFHGNRKKFRPDCCLSSMRSKTRWDKPVLSALFSFSARAAAHCMTWHLFEGWSAKAYKTKTAFLLFKLLMSSLKIGFFLFIYRPYILDK